MQQTNYQRRLGERLREIRQQQSLTLQEVEEKSRGRWKAVVVGSYERGDRAVSVAKLAALAEFYGVPMRELLPVTATEAGALRAASDSPRVVLDLTRLELGDDQMIEPIRRFVRAIQIRRGDYNGRVLTLRAADLDALAIALGREPDQLSAWLSSQGMLVG